MPRYSIAFLYLLSTLAPKYATKCGSLPESIIGKSEATDLTSGRLPESQENHGYDFGIILTFGRMIGDHRN